MNTESDLRAVLTEQAHDISEPDAILARVHVTDRRPVARRRWIAPVAAAAAVAAAVVTAGLLVADHEPTRATNRRRRCPAGSTGICGSRPTSVRSRATT